MLSLPELFGYFIVYLTVLFGSAYATEKGWIPEKIATHPAVKVLSLGVITGAMAFYGTLEFAHNHGGSFLIYFVGLASAFIAATFIFKPLIRIALTHKLGSIADVFAFRYPAPWVGGTITLLMLMGVLPLLALQIQVVSLTMHAVSPDLSEDIFAAFFCTIMTLFAILFGARHLSTRDKHQGLVLAIGLESLIKLAAFVVLATLTLTEVFGGFAPVAEWFTQNRGLLEATNDELSAGSSRAFLILFFGAAVTMPHIYHMLITESDDANALPAARWGFPAYLLILSLCIPPLVWGAVSLGSNVEPGLDALTIGTTLDNQAMLTTAFIAGLAATSGVLIVTTLALASMTLNHILLPLSRPIEGVNVYSLLLNTRRVLIAAIILTAFIVHILIGTGQSQINLGIIACIATLQFLPGLVAAFYWQKANRNGLLAGLLMGFLVWAAAFLPTPFALVGPTASLNAPEWGLIIWTSLIANTIFLIVVSLMTEQTMEEAYAANECVSEDLVLIPGQPQAKTVSEMESSLALALGPKASSREVNLALEELSIGEDEIRPHALSQLRSRMETNLSSVLGQTIAHRIIGRVLPLRSQHSEDRVHVLESHLEDYQSQLTGLAAELDDLRRYHRQTLHDLPAAVFSVDQTMIIRSWNRAMESLTHIPSEQTIGRKTSDLPAPWRDVLGTFIYGDDTHNLRYELKLESDTLYLNFHKASIFNTANPLSNLVIVVEDLTETQQLEEQLVHKERLASIGQLAAGVAHEIGNPVTSIACLAQDLKLESEDRSLLELSEQILIQTDRISTILQSLVSFTHGGKAGTERSLIPVRISQCVDESIQLLSLQERKSVNLVNRCGPDATVLGDAQRLVQVFINVLDNAVDASSEGGAVTVYSEADGDEITLIIEDEGHGLPKDEIDSIFEPFFTTKDPGYGTGLGLAIVSSIVAEHQGSVTAEPKQQQGTQVIIKLPAYRGESDGSGPC